MKIKLDLLKDYIADSVAEKVENMEIDATKIADTKAIIMLGEISAILQNKELEPFDMVTAISEVFAENRLDGVWWNE